MNAATIPSPTFTLSTPIILAIIIGAVFLSFAGLTIGAWVAYKREYAYQVKTIMMTELEASGKPYLVINHLDHTYNAVTDKDARAIRPRKETVAALKSRISRSLSKVWHVVSWPVRCFKPKPEEKKLVIKVVSRPLACSDFSSDFS
jgi:hypothetical protein